MPIDSGNLALKGLDDLFSTEENRQEEQREQVQQIPIDALHPFTNHPFKVLDDEAMTRTVESIAQYGVLAPLIARPRPDGNGYEIISGHRRQYAAKLAGLDTLPVIVRQMIQQYDEEQLMQKAANRMKAITAIQTAVADCEKHKAVHDKYIKIGWKIRKEAYVESHKDELTAFNKAYRILKKHGADLNVDLKALQKEYDGLRTTHADLKEQLAAVNEELKPMKDIRYWVSKVLSPEQTGEKQPEPKHSLKERLQYEQEQKKQKQVQKAPKQKKQDMEL